MDDNIESGSRGGIIPFEGKAPVIGENAMIFNSAVLMGDVKVGKNANIWDYVVIRADLREIAIGDNCSIQEHSALHVTGEHGVKIGNDVTIGHGVVLHGCTIGNNCLIGMNATVLNGAVIGDNSIVGAGAVVTEGKEFPENSLILGVPARVVRTLDEHGIKLIRHHMEANQNLLERWKRNMLM